METPGLILKREREAKGLTLTELSKITRISEATLETIENNEFDALPAEVFVRGFLRNYARQLSLSTEEVIASYEEWRRLNRSQEETLALDDVRDGMSADNDDAVEGMESAPRHVFRFAYVAIVLIAVASVGLSLFFMGTGEAEESGMDFVEQQGDTVESPFLISNTSDGWLVE